MDYQHEQRIPLVIIHISLSSYSALGPPMYRGLVLAQMIAASPICLREILIGTTVG